MTDVPERIWAWAHSQRSFLAYEDKPDPPASPTEYVRADTHAAVVARVNELEAAGQSLTNAMASLGEVQAEFGPDDPRVFPFRKTVQVKFDQMRVLCRPATEKGTP